MLRRALLFSLVLASFAVPAWGDSIGFEISDLQVGYYPNFVDYSPGMVVQPAFIANSAFVFYLQFTGTVTGSGISFPDVGVFWKYSVSFPDIEGTGFVYALTADEGTHFYGAYNVPVAYTNLYEDVAGPFSTLRVTIEGVKCFYPECSYPTLGTSLADLGSYDFTVPTLPAPEPSSLVLLGSGAIAIAGSVRGRRKKKPTTKTT